MATSTLVQRLVAGEDVSFSNRRQVETFLAGGTIAAGDWVQFDSTKTDQDRVLYVTAASAGTATGNPLVCGVALAAATSGKKVDVVVSGYVEGAKVDNAVAASGVALIVDNTGAGIANALAAADTAPPCGVSLEAAAAGLADVWVFKRF